MASTYGRGKNKCPIFTMFRVYRDRDVAAKSVTPNTDNYSVEGYPLEGLMLYSVRALLDTLEVVYAPELYLKSTKFNDTKIHYHLYSGAYARVTSARTSAEKNRHGHKFCKITDEKINSYDKSITFFTPIILD